MTTPRERGRALAKRLNEQTILERMPKIWFVFDEYRNEYRVGRTDWPGDRFDFLSTEKFNTFKEVYESLGFKLEDKTFFDE